jgi:hypothetical protein
MMSRFRYYCIQPATTLMRDTGHELDNLAQAVREADNWWTAFIAFTSLSLALLLLAVMGAMCLAPVVAVLVLTLT